MRVHILYISEDPSPLEANRSCIATKRHKKVTPACGFSFCLVTGPAAQVPRGRGVRQSVFRRRGNTVVHSRCPNAMLLSSKLCTSTVRGGSLCAGRSMHRTTVLHYDGADSQAMCTAPLWDRGKQKAFRSSLLDASLPHGCVSSRVVRALAFVFS